MSSTASSGTRRASSAASIMRRDRCRSGRPWPHQIVGPCSACIIGPVQRHVRSGQRTRGSVWFVRTALCPLVSAARSTRAKRQVVRVADRWPRRPLASVLGGLKLDRDIFVALMVSALHGVRPPVDPKTPVADRAAPAQVRVLLTVTPIVVFEEDAAHVVLLNHVVSPSGPA